MSMKKTVFAAVAQDFPTYFKMDGTVITGCGSSLTFNEDKTVVTGVKGGDKAREKLTKVVIPKGVTKIG